jgi:hypothetical protein
MPIYEYYCEANDETVEVNHPMAVSLAIWGQVCYVAGIPLGDTDPEAPVKRVIRSAPAVSVPTGNSTLKEKGFTKLVKRDDGVYENVTASGDEKRYMTSDDPDSLPHLDKKIDD